MKSIYHIVLAAAIALVMYACQDVNDFETTYNPNYPVVGSWYTTIVDSDDPDTKVPDIEIDIYNTASNDSIFIQEHGYAETLVRAVRNGNTFSVTGYADLGSNGLGNVDIQGEIFNKDSIHLVFDFTQLDFTVTANGHRKTGLEHH